MGKCYSSTKSNQTLLRFLRAITMVSFNFGLEVGFVAATSVWELNF